MKIPNLSCKIEMFCTVNPSESIEKIEQAISNIFPYAIINNKLFLTDLRINNVLIQENINLSLFKKGC